MLSNFFHCDGDPKVPRQPPVLDGVDERFVLSAFIVFEAVAWTEDLATRSIRGPHDVDVRKFKFFLRA
jgi:hypothetical protein